MLMYSALVKRGLFRMADIKAAPDLSRILPVLRRGASLQVTPLVPHHWAKPLSRAPLPCCIGTAPRLTTKVTPPL